MTGPRRPARPRKPTKVEQQTTLVVVGAVAAGVLLTCGTVGQLMFGDSEDPAPVRTRPPAAATTRPAVTTSPTVRPEHSYLFLPPDAPVPSGAGVPAVPDPNEDADNPPDEPADEDEGVYYPNCAAARRAGAAPMFRGEPGYRRALDRDNDGVACDG